MARMDNYTGDHSDCYEGFSELEGKSLSQPSFRETIGSIQGKV